MTGCPSCGHDSEAVAAPLFSDEAAAELAEAEVIAAETYAADREEDRETAVELAQVREEGETERTRIREEEETERTRIAAEAVVEVAEEETEQAEAGAAEAAALADAAEALTDDTGEEAPVELENHDTDGVTPVEVPPQPEETPAPAQRSESNGARRSTRRRRWGRS